MGVVVYVIKDSISSDYRAKVAQLFENKDVEVRIPDIKYGDILSENHLPERQEAYQVGWCLTDSKDTYPSNSVLIVKDSSTCFAGKEILNKVLREIRKIKHTFHVCYLGKWGDRCHLYSQRTRIKGTNYDIVKTSFPHGIQALFFSPEGRDVILGAEPMKNGEYFRARGSIAKSLTSNIRRGNLDAYCVTPNVIDYDLSLSLKDEDYLKLNQCEGVLRIDESKSGINRCVAIFVIIILLIIIVVAAITVYP